MKKGLIFFCCASCILLLTIINFSIGPIINQKVKNWGTVNCAKIKDKYKEVKKSVSGDALKYGAKWQLDECQRVKGMHDMEYTAFIFDLVIGFSCGILGLLHLFEVKKDIVSKTGLIGLGCGAVGFILTFVYIILNGLIYTKFDTKNPKLNSDGAYAERDGQTENYKCIYYNEKNPHKAYATISDLGKKQYNYDKKLYKSITTSDCMNPNYFVNNCDENGDGTFNAPSMAINNCKYIFLEASTEVENKDISDRFLTVFILSLFICLASIGLAIFGLLLFMKPDDF